VLVARFADAGGKVVSCHSILMSCPKVGERLIGLYAILHFALANGDTVILEEPDNFISLREIQPWPMAVSDTVEEKGGQIPIISHHPELIDQWASPYGDRFVREPATARHRCGTPYPRSGGWSSRYSVPPQVLSSCRKCARRSSPGRCTRTRGC